MEEKVHVTNIIDPEKIVSKVRKFLWTESFFHNDGELKAYCISKCNNVKF